jgi:hypothetical protein
MRQNFINPVELPVLSECFLRNDFNLATYFGLCLADYMGRFFNAKSFAALLVMLGLWRVLNFLDSTTGSIIVLITPVLNFVLLIIMNW